MSTFVFKAMDVAGVKAKGEVEAESKQAVADQLKARGMIVLEIADKHASREIELAFMQRVKAQDLAVFSRQLATMITSGMTHPARALRARGADREQVPQGHDRRGAQGRRGGPATSATRWRATPRSSTRCSSR